MKNRQPIVFREGAAQPLNLLRNRTEERKNNSRSFRDRTFTGFNLTKFPVKKKHHPSLPLPIAPWPLEGRGKEKTAEESSFSSRTFLNFLSADNHNTTLRLHRQAAVASGTCIDAAAGVEPGTVTWICRVLRIASQTDRSG